MKIFLTNSLIFLGTSFLQAGEAPSINDVFRNIGECARTQSPVSCANAQMPNSGWYQHERDGIFSLATDAIFGDKLVIQCEKGEVIVAVLSDEPWGDRLSASVKRDGQPLSPLRGSYTSNGNAVLGREAVVNALVETDYYVLQADAVREPRRTVVFDVRRLDAVWDRLIALCPGILLARD